MSSITIQVPRELATRLKPYRRKLPQILELGLKQLESESKPNRDLRERTIQALKSTGLVHLPQPRKGARRRHTPLNIPGKPLSEMIIEQRGRL